MIIIIIIIIIRNNNNNNKEYNKNCKNKIVLQKKK